MKRFFEEHTSVVIIYIVVSLLLCIIGSIKGISSSETSVDGSGLLKIVGDNLTDTIDTYQKQVVPNENLLSSYIIKPQGNQIEYFGYDITDAVKKYADTSDKISISADVKGSKKGTCLIYSLGSYCINHNKEPSYDITTNYKRLKLENVPINYITGSSHGDHCILSFFSFYNSGVKLSIRNIKVELGSKATPYSN